MALAPVVILPNSLETLVARIGTLSDKGYRILRDEVGGDDAFNADNDRCERLAADLALPTEDIPYLLATLELLYGRLKGLRSEAQRAAAIGHLVGNFDESQLAEQERGKLIARLIELTAPNSQVDLAQKVRRLRTGFLDNATAFSTFVDVRPDYTSEYEAISRLVPIIQLMVSTDAEDPTKRHVVFQLDEKALAGLKSIVSDTEKKLQTLKNQSLATLDILFEKAR